MDNAFCRKGLVQGIFCLPAQQDFAFSRFEVFEIFFQRHVLSSFIDSIDY